MAYRRWNKRKIKNQMKYLKARYDYTKDERFLVDAKNLACLLDGSIDLFNVPFTFRDQIEDDAQALDLYYDFLDDIVEFAKVNAPKFQNHVLNEVDGIGNLTPTLIFSFLKEFFYEVDKEFGELFDEVYEERANNLMFSDGRSICYFVPAIRYSYLNITKNDTVDDFLNAVHEYTHAIVDRMCYREAEGDYPFCELVSMFMELIAADYLCEVYLGMEDDLNTVLLSGAKKITIYAENISIEKDYFYTHDEMSDQKQVIQGMQNISGKSKSYIKRLLDKTAMEKLTYSIPYLTAIELYYLYKSDKDRCIEIIKYLIYVKGIENYNVDLNDHGIVLNQHSSEWVDKLLHYKKG